MRKIVVLDAAGFGYGIDFYKFEKYGEVTIYETSTIEEAAERVRDAAIIITTKVPMNETTLTHATKLEMVCELATGIDNLDTEYLASRNIPYRNVVGYGTESVAQHTIALTLNLLEQLPFYMDYVKNGEYSKSESITNCEKPFHELSDMTWGIIGLGNIGRKVAQIAQAFGCHIIYYSTSGKNHSSDYEQVDWNTLLTTSDIITVHAPLNEQTRDLIKPEDFARMKKNCLLVNVARGPIVDENALANALTSHQIAGAGLDVLPVEPLPTSSPLYPLLADHNLIVTPHMAWGSLEARDKMVQIMCRQLDEYYAL